MDWNLCHITDNCSQALELFRASGRLLFRGTGAAGPAPALHASAAPGQAKLDPTDDPDFEKLFNSWLRRRYGKGFPQRTGAIFAIASHYLASQYGTVCMLFPHDTATTTFALGLVDPYPVFEDWCRYEACELTQGVTSNRFRDACGDMWILMAYAERYPTFRRAIESCFFEQYHFRTGSYTDALIDGCEVWLHGNCHLVPLGDDYRTVLSQLNLENCGEWVAEQLETTRGRLTRHSS